MISWKNIKNSLRYALKTSKIENLRLHSVEKRSRDSSTGKLEPLKYFQRLAKRIWVTWPKNHADIFHEKILQQNHRSLGLLQSRISLLSFLVCCKRRFGLYLSRVQCQYWECVLCHRENHLWFQLLFQTLFVWHLIWLQWIFHWNLWQKVLAEG